jgi:hypothetical protein
MCLWICATHRAVGFDHINRNAPVLIRTPKLTRFEPAQYWGGGPPGNSVVLNPLSFARLGQLFLALFDYYVYIDLERNDLARTKWDLLVHHIHIITDNNTSYAY